MINLNIYKTNETIHRTITTIYETSEEWKNYKFCIKKGNYSNLGNKNVPRRSSKIK